MYVVHMLMPCYNINNAAQSGIKRVFSGKQSFEKFVCVFSFKFHSRQCRLVTSPNQFFMDRFCSSSGEGNLC